MNVRNNIDHKVQPGTGARPIVRHLAFAERRVIGTCLLVFAGGKKKYLD